MYRTGQTAPSSGRYAFAGYIDGSSYPTPTSEERIIPLSARETFPPIKSANKGAYWNRLA